MGTEHRNHIQHLLTHLPGWLFLTAGLALVSLTVLMPARQDLVQLKGKLKLMQTQADHMGTQESAYQRFHLALRTDDPILLSRLAYHQLHLKPAGSDLLEDQADQAATIASLLHTPMPAHQAASSAKPQSRLVRLTCGPQRLGVLAVGILCICAGLMLPIEKNPSAR
jgi:hypothetical protein